MDYLKYLTEEIHTVVAATTDDEGLPVTCAIDMMDADEDGLYFLTALANRSVRRLVLILRPHPQLLCRRIAYTAEIALRSVPQRR